MFRKMLRQLSAVAPRAQKPCGRFDWFWLGGRKYSVRRFRLHTVGYATAITHYGLFGLQADETLIINPSELAVPMFLYDRHLTLRRDTRTFALMDKTWEHCNFFSMEKVLQEADLIANGGASLGYVPAQLPYCFAKRTKRNQARKLDWLASLYYNAYLELLNNGSPLPQPLKEDHRAYRTVEHLAVSNAPHIRRFRKKFGHLATHDFLHYIVFSTKQ